MLRLEIAEDIFLKPLSVDMAEEAFGLIEKNREFLRRFLSFIGKTKTLEDERKFLETVNKKEFPDTFAIMSSDEMIGTIGIVDFNEGDGELEIGYWMCESFQGRGIMTNACKVLMDYALERYDVDSFIITCDPKNTKSAAVAERLGFGFVGILDEHRDSTGEVLKNVKKFVLLT